MRGVELLTFLASVPPDKRDATIEAHLGISAEVSSAPPGEELIGYHPSGVATIVRALVEVPVVPDDVVIDLGSGLGKVVCLAHLLTGATARGIEIQGPLVAHARRAAAQRALDVQFTEADARHVNIDDGTVFFLYAPCTGRAQIEVLERLHEVARKRAVVVCALGVDLHRHAPWLVARPLDSFWLTLYDSVVPGALPLPPRAPSPLARAAEAVASERFA